MRKHFRGKDRIIESLLTCLCAAMVLSISVQDASAQVPDRPSHVTDSVVDNSDGTFTYGYRVWNDSDPFDGENPSLTVEPEEPVDLLIRDWELPYFDDAGITNILSPTGWSHTIETIGTANPATGWEGVANWQDPNDPFYFGPSSPFSTHSQVLHWYVIQPLDFDSMIFPQESLAGFSFDASFDETAAPYQASWFELPVQTGDPAFPAGMLPASPAAVGVVPEPTSLAIFGVGTLGIVVGSIRRRRRKLTT